MEVTHSFRGVLTTALAVAYASYNLVSAYASDTGQLGVRNIGRGLADAPITAAAPFEFSGTPVPYVWGSEFATALSEDSARYEEELSELLDSPLSEWEEVPREGYTLAGRPIMRNGEPALVSYFSKQYNSPGARAFFDFLVQPEGSDLLDPDASQRVPVDTAEAPNGATAFSTASVSDFSDQDPPLPPAILVASWHWQTCGPNEQTNFNYPASIPAGMRPPDVANVTGTIPDWTLAIATRAVQVDAETMELRYVLWFSLADGLPPAVQLASHEGFFLVVDGRMSEHLEATEYSPDGATECPDMMHGMGGGYGGYGDEDV